MLRVKKNALYVNKQSVNHLTTQPQILPKNIITCCQKQIPIGRCRLLGFC